MPLAKAAVLATSAGDSSGCPRVELAASAGTAYRVQSTLTSFYGGVATLRARAVGTPPAVTFGARSCAAQACQIDVEALPAPGTTLSSVECRLNADAWEPCTPTGSSGHWSLAFPGSGDQRLAARVLDSSGRQSLTKTRMAFPIPVQAGVGAPAWQPPPGQAPKPSTKPRPARLRTPTARFEVTGRGTRVRSLTVPWLPSGATAAVRCRGANCAFMRRTLTQRRSGPMRLTKLFARRMLTPATTIEVTVSARDRTTRTTRWTTRTGRLPKRAKG